MKLYKFRPLVTDENLTRVKSIFECGFYCSNFLDFNDVNEGVYPISKNSTLNLGDKLTYKICSFSSYEALDSQIMWGHYARSGMGVVIETILDDSSHIEPIRYSGPRKYRTTKDVLTNKASEWRHENEFRFIRDTNECYFKSKITKIFLGAPYEGLVNYPEIKEKHSMLRKYLELAHELTIFAEKEGVVCKKFHLSSHA